MAGVLLLDGLNPMLWQLKDEKALRDDEAVSNEEVADETVFEEESWDETASDEEEANMAGSDEEARLVTLSPVRKQSPSDTRSSDTAWYERTVKSSIVYYLHRMGHGTHRVVCFNMSFENAGGSTRALRIRRSM